MAYSAGAAKLVRTSATKPGTTMVFTLVSGSRKPCTTSAELHRRAGRDQNAARHKIILLGDEPHRGGTVGRDRGAKIALDKLTPEMKGLRVDDLDIAGRM